MRLDLTTTVEAIVQPLFSKKAKEIVFTWCRRGWAHELQAYHVARATVTPARTDPGRPVRPGEGGFLIQNRRRRLARLRRAVQGAGPQGGQGVA